MMSMNQWRTKSRTAPRKETQPRELKQKEQIEHIHQMDQMIMVELQQSL